MIKTIRILYLFSVLFVGIGLALHIALSEHWDKTFSYGEAYFRFANDGISKSLESFIFVILFLMMVFGIALSGFTLAQSVEQKKTGIGKIIRWTVVGAAILYFGVGLIFIIVT